MATTPRDHEGRLGWVSAARVAKLLAVSTRTIARWCESGKIPARRFGERGQYHIDRKWFEAVKERQREDDKAAEELSAAIQPIKR